MAGEDRPAARRERARKTPSAVTESRRAAASVLWAVSRGRRLDRALEEASASLSARERRWVQEATYGSLRFRGRLDHLLSLHLAKGLSSLPPRVLDLLRLGAYQILYMDAVPAYAAVSQTVDQVTAEMGGGGGGMANGVLRSLGREGGGEDRFPRFEDDPLRHLSTWGSHPAWLVERWLRRWGPEATRGLVAANNLNPPLYFRPLKGELEEALGRMASRGWRGMEIGHGVPCLRMEDGTNPARLLEELPGIIQDPGAALVSVYADPPAGEAVMDLCAAPGGKALALAGGGNRVLAGDRSFPRARILREAVERTNATVDVFVADARRPPLAKATFVLLDVPCTGTGTLRRHPDARWRLTPAALRELVELQREILDACGGVIRAGGHLVYSTCTLEEEENEGQVADFLKKHSGFRIEETGKVSPRFLAEDGSLRILPQEWGFDGAYAARMARIP